MSNSPNRAPMSRYDALEIQREEYRCRGYSEGRRAVVGHLLDEAAALFRKGDDDRAKELRRIAVETDKATSPGEGTEADLDLYAAALDDSFSLLLSKGELSDEEEEAVLAARGILADGDAHHASMPY